MILIYSELRFFHKFIDCDSVYVYNLFFSFQMSVEMFDYMDDILNLQHAGTLKCYLICLKILQLHIVLCET